MCDDSLSKLWTPGQLFFQENIVNMAFQTSAWLNSTDPLQIHRYKEPNYSFRFQAILRRGGINGLGVKIILMLLREA